MPDTKPKTPEELELARKKFAKEGKSPQICAFCGYKKETLTIMYRSPGIRNWFKPHFPVEICRDCIRDQQDSGRNSALAAIAIASWIK